MAIDDFAGFGIEGYRSFGSAQMALFGPTAKVHLIVGRNNVGKSNALHFAHNVVGGLRSGIAQESSHLYTGSLDVPSDWIDSKVRRISLALRKTEAVCNTLMSGAFKPLENLFATPAFARGSGDLIWFDFEAPVGGGLQVSRQQLDEAAKQGGPVEGLDQVALSALHQSVGNAYANWRSIVDVLRPWDFIPFMQWVDTFRRITNTGNPESGLRSGEGLIGSLAALQSPEFVNHAASTAKWNALQAFVRNVLDDESAHIQVPTSKETILVATTLHQPMPLENLGTGIGEVIHLAAVATTINSQLICVEEPELHLHPTLQRMLVHYLHHETSNRYLISTHSASILNAQLATITHLTREGQWTHATTVVDHTSLATAVSDLGNRASDIVQSNFIIWVEGPSDRIYIRHWLETLDDELIEGAHYSIMFYGGALLNHLSADDQETTEFIQLLKINRNLSLVMDSDKKSASDEVNATKQRVLDELAKINALGWVTSGYTIENYLDVGDISSAIAELYPKKQYELPEGQWASPLGATFTQTETKPSKVMVARNVINLRRPVDTWPLELREKIADLSARVRAANDLPVKN